jgi:hypothetical protein
MRYDVVGLIEYLGDSVAVIVIVRASIASIFLVKNSAVLLGMPLLPAVAARKSQKGRAHNIGTRFGASANEVSGIFGFRLAGVVAYLAVLWGGSGFRSHSWK